jgi:hypothetical protein
MRNPVVVCGFGKSDHCLFHVLLDHISVALAQQIDDPLMQIEVFVPYRLASPAGNHARPHEGEERRQDPLGVIEKVFVSREAADRASSGDATTRVSLRGGLATTV